MNKPTSNIEKFLRTAYTDESLAMLKAQIEDGKFSYRTCCCLIGIPTADHALRPLPLAYLTEERPLNHYERARRLPYAKAAEAELRLIFRPHEIFFKRGDGAVRQFLLPLVDAEINWRADRATKREENSQKEPVETP